jgi:hypothetical protein
MGCSIRLEIRKNDGRRRPASTRSFNYRVWRHSRRTRSPLSLRACQEIDALSVIASSCRPRATRRDETAGVRRGVPLNASGGRRDSFAVSSLFKGLRIGEFRCPPIPANDAEDGRGVATPSVRRDCRRRCTGVLRTARIWRDSNSVSFVFKGLQGGKVPLSPSRRGEPDAWTAALASRAFQETARGRAVSERKRAASAICGSRPRAVDDSARRPRRRRARHAAAGFLREHGDGFSSSEVERRE